MATSDAFTQQIIKLVRSMPDDAILALVKNQLGLDGGRGLVAGAARTVSTAPKAKRGRRPKGKPAAPAPAAKVTAPRPAAPSPPSARRLTAPTPVKASKPAKVKKATRGRPPRGGADRSEVLGVVERAIKNGNGMAASDVAKATGIPQSRATAAIKELKLAKRIFQGGDRRFARYAGDARTAQTASENARKTASGPVLKGKKRR
jgi:hypothetical protein